jgi:hypothetical protein
MSPNRKTSFFIEDDVKGDSKASLRRFVQEPVIKLVMDATLPDQQLREKGTPEAATRAQTSCFVSVDTTPVLADFLACGRLKPGSLKKPPSVYNSNNNNKVPKPAITLP